MTNCKYHGYKSHKGFTLIELVIVIVILAIISAIAVPKFISLTRDARVEVLTQVEVSVKIANDFMFLTSQLPSYKARPVPNREDLTDVDTNGDGIYDTRLKWNYLDNTDIEQRIDISGDFVIQEQGIAHTYIGYKFAGNNNVWDGECYFKYTQASDGNTPPVYGIIDTGC